MIYLFWQVLLIAMVLLIAYHDVYRSDFCESAHNYNFVKDRYSKIMKLCAILLATLSLWVITKDLYYTFSPLITWILLFDVFYYWVGGVELTWKYYVKHSEIYYWYLIIFKKER